MNDTSQIVVLNLTNGSTSVVSNFDPAVGLANGVAGHRLELRFACFGGYRIGGDWYLQAATAITNDRRIP